jgi:hypothetical protein
MRDRSACKEISMVVEVDQKDTFFFDHNIDHVPGMVLVEAALEAVAPDADSADGTSVLMRLEFTKICELDTPVQLKCIETAEERRWEVQFVQNDVGVCSGTIQLAGPCAVQADSNEPAPATLVHRLRPENILVGALERWVCSPLITPPISRRCGLPTVSR